MLETTQKIDLFEQWEKLPQPVQDILSKYSEAENYSELEAMLSELKPLGYIFDYGLDCSPYNLRPLTEYDGLTVTQIQRRASSKIKKYVSEHPNKHLQYYFVRGIFHFNNIDGFETAKSICERATGLKFKHFTNSMCKLDEQYY